MNNEKISIARIFTVSDQEVLVKIEKDIKIEGDLHLFCIMFETFFVTNKKLHWRAGYWSLGCFPEWNEKDTWETGSQKALRNATEKDVERFIFDKRQTINLDKGEYFL